MMDEGVPTGRLFMTVWLPLLLSAMLAAPPLAGPGAPTDDVPNPLRTVRAQRVRTTDTVLQRFIDEGMRRSLTFADLVAAVNATDVIVYVQRVDRLAPTVAGQLMLIEVPNAQRYLRIQIRRSLPPNEMIALIGHELRHALEVAAAPQVRTQSQMAALYERIGRSGGQHAYDTSAAQNAGDRVRGELAG
jgi:hypothetical protein